MGLSYLNNFNELSVLTSLCIPIAVFTLAGLVQPCVLVVVDRTSACRHTSSQNTSRCVCNNCSYKVQQRNALGSGNESNQSIATQPIHVLVNVQIQQKARNTHNLLFY
jgi:hypothetical protein